VLLAVVEQLSDVSHTSVLLNQGSIIDFIVVVDKGSLVERNNLVDMSLAGGEDLDGALPNSIDLVQSTRGSVAGTGSNSSSSSSSSSSSDGGTSGDAAEPGRSLGNSGLGGDDLLLLSNDLSSRLLDSDLFLLLRDLLLASDDSGNLSLINDLLNLLCLLEGLVGLNLIGPGVYVNKYESPGKY